MKGFDTLRNNKGGAHAQDLLVEDDRYSATSWEIASEWGDFSRFGRGFMEVLSLFVQSVPHLSSWDIGCHF